MQTGRVDRCEWPAWVAIGGDMHTLFVRVLGPAIDGFKKKKKTGILKTVHKLGICYQVEEHTIYF